VKYRIERGVRRAAIARLRIYRSCVRVHLRAEQRLQVVGEMRWSGHDGVQSSFVSRGARFQCDNNFRDVDGTSRD